ncbi:MAG: hypothetical protein ACI4A3_12460 [Lachnospiraceae bacterium]
MHFTRWKIEERNKDGSVDSYKLTFVLKGNGNRVIENARERYKKTTSCTQ